MRLRNQSSSDSRERGERRWGPPGTRRAAARAGARGREERLARIREVVHRSLRYYDTAYLKTDVAKERVWLPGMWRPPAMIRGCATVARLVKPTWFTYRGWMKGFARARAWFHWRRNHRHASATERYESFQTYTGSLHDTARDLSYSDIQCQLCNELGARLRLPWRGAG